MYLLLYCTSCQCLIAIPGTISEAVQLIKWHSFQCLIDTFINDFLKNGLKKLVECDTTFM